MTNNEQRTTMPFTVMSYNIQLGGRGRLRAISNVIRSQRPDVVALIEANDLGNVRALASELEMEMVFAEANSPHHIAWLSGLPILRSQNHRLPHLSRTLLEMEVLAGAGDPFLLFATHLSPVLEPADNLRLREAQVVLDVIASHAHGPHLLVGDFNALHPEDSFGIPPPREADAAQTAPTAPRQVIKLFLDAGYVDCYRLLHPESPGYTYPTDCPWARIDFILASPNLAQFLHSCDVVAGQGPERASDHFPISASFDP
jgi:endonuclease/exonuclease/phosphatase family metal-dependent hydrolase